MVANSRLEQLRQKPVWVWVLLSVVQEPPGLLARPATWYRLVRLRLRRLMMSWLPTVVVH